MIIDKMAHTHNNCAVRYACSKAMRVRKRAKLIWNNYYIKSWIECRENKKFLEGARSKDKNLNNENPLISVCIPTYNRGEILTKRAIPSVLRQTYENFELIIVGDHCTDNTERLIDEIGDDRIKFYNLPSRGIYPKNPFYRWMVAGTAPSNKAIELSSGAWIAPLDDDDEFSDDHLEILLNYALEYDYEMVYGVVQMEIKPGQWINLGSYPLKCGCISRLSVLYQSKLNFFKYNINAWKYEEPADWDMWRRMKEAGVKIGFLNEIVGKHYLERTTIPTELQYHESSPKRGPK